MTKDPKDRLIVALDVPVFDEARDIVEKLGDAVGIYKVGYQLFVAYGPFVVRFLEAQGKKVFLDLKFHDIPNTVANAVSSAVALGVQPHEALNARGEKTNKFSSLFMLTVHTQGGPEMMKAAAEAARKCSGDLQLPKPLIVGVTVLTSDAPTPETPKIVLERARAAKASGLDGVVCSVEEAAMLRREMGKDFILVTPGIRPAGADAGDQKRVDTPLAAIQAGSDFLVIGRPIVKAPDPRAAALKILEVISKP
jgi:orotidine-5'-phosphate decarboxylase